MQDRIGIPVILHTKSTYVVKSTGWIPGFKLEQRRSGIIDNYTRIYISLPSTEDRDTDGKRQGKGGERQVVRALEVSTCLPWNVQVTHGHYPKDASRMTGGLDERRFL